MKFIKGQKAWNKVESNKICKEYGWKTLFFNETEVNEEYILSILGGDK